MSGGGGTMEVLTRLVSTGHSVLFAPSGLGRVSSEPVTRGGIFMPASIIVCSDCEKTAPLTGFGRCRNCYYTWRRRQSGAKPKFYHTEESRRAHNAENSRKSYELHRAEVLERSRQRYAAHREEIRARQTAWDALNRESKRESWRKWRARRQSNGAPATLSVAEWNTIKDAFDHGCAYCGIHSERLTQDHVMPVSRGGAHIMGNVVPACKSCNCRKSDKTPEEWFSAIG